MKSILAARIAFGCLLTGFVSDLPAQVFVANSNGNSVLSFSTSPGIDPPPLTTITDSSDISTPYAVAVDSSQVYVASIDNNTIEVYARTDNGASSPVAVISNSGITSPFALAVDSNYIYLTNAGGGGLNGPDSVLIFSLTATGNVSPVATIEGGNTGLSYPQGVAVDSNNIYVSNSGNGTITVYPLSSVTTGTLNLTPSATITGLVAPTGMAVNSTSMFVVDVGASTPAIESFPLSATGAATPTTVIGGLNTGVSSNTNSVAVDSSNIYAADTVEDSINIYPLSDNGNVSPTLVITGGATTLNGPIGIAVAPTAAVSPPAVSSLGTSTGPSTGGTSVVITGANFTGATAVKFGPTAATSFTVNSATQITAVAPAGTGTVYVTVTVSSQTSVTGAADQFTYAAAAPAPIVTLLSTSSGISTGGTTVTITGNNFTGATAVTFGVTAAASFTLNSATQITATSPAGAGSVNVTVTTPAGTSATNASDRFSYVGVPAVSTLGTSAGAVAAGTLTGPATGGTSVYIYGSNFSGAQTVLFGLTPATQFAVENSTEILATAPAGSGTVDVVVVTSVGASALNSPADHFTYAAAPIVSSLSVSGGPLSGGTYVYVTGANLYGASAVMFGATPATSFTVSSITQIIALAPAGSGTVDVTVTTPGGTSAINSPADQFTYAAAPAVASVSPSGGPVAGGTVVAIAGTNFTGASAVHFGSAAATAITLNGPTQLTVTSPAGSGVVDVTVTTAAGTSAVNSPADRFTYTVATTTAAAAASVAAVVTPSVKTTVATGIGSPAGVAFDPKGSLYVSNFATPGTVYQVGSGGQLSPFATTSGPAFGIAFDAAGNLYIATPSSGDVKMVGPKGGLASNEYATGIGQPLYLAFDASGNLYISDGLGGAVDQSSGGGSEQLYASGFSDPQGIAFDSQGNLYVADGGDEAVVWQVTPGAAATNIYLGGYVSPQGIAIDPQGNLYSADDTGTAGIVYQLNNGSSLTDLPYSSSVFATGFVQPRGLACDGAGNVYVADAGASGGVLYKIAPASIAARQITLSATVKTAVGTVNAGMVTFTVLSQGAALGTSVTANVSGGAATAAYLLPAGTLPGSYSITAAYTNSGGTFAASSDSTQNVTVTNPVAKPVPDLNLVANTDPTSSATYDLSASTATYNGAPVAGSFSVVAPVDAGDGPSITIPPGFAGWSGSPPEFSIWYESLDGSVTIVAPENYEFLYDAVEFVPSSPSYQSVFVVPSQVGYVIPPVPTNTIRVGVGVMGGTGAIASSLAQLVPGSGSNTPHPASSQSGPVAAALSLDGKTGFLTGYISATGQGFACAFSPDASGNFSVTTSTVGGTGKPVTLTITGTATASGISGTILPNKVTFSCSFGAPNGPTATLSGIFQTAGPNNSTAYTLVDSQGHAFAMEIAAGGVAAGSGTVNPATGAIAIPLSPSGSVTGTISASNRSISETVTANGTTTGFSGTASAPAPVAALVNLSALGLVTPNASLTVGFVVNGPQAKTVLLRGVGPGLSSLASGPLLAVPHLSLYGSAGGLLATNSGWDGSTALSSAFTQAGAFGLSPSSADTALETTLQPGSYTAVVSDAVNDAGGVALAEIYDLSIDLSETKQSLINESAVGRVTAANPLTGGFVIDGSSPKTVLVRAVGPGLASLGVASPLADPTLTVTDSTGAVLARNNDWGTPDPVTTGQSVASASDITAAEAATGAFPLSTGSQDSAVIVTLSPGNYTAAVTGVDGPSGTALVEIYEVP